MHLIDKNKHFIEFLVVRRLICNKSAAWAMQKILTQEGCE